MRVARYLARRLALALLVVVGVVTVAFVVTRALPGDPVRMLLGPQARPADVARARGVYGLDQPLHAQYLRFWSRLMHRAEGDPAGHESCAAFASETLHVDLGFSYRYRRPVVDLVAQKAPISAQLALAALLLQALFGVSIGLAAGRAREVVTLGTVASLVVVLPVALQVPNASQVGLPWQGRYLLAVSVGVPLLVVLGDERHGRPRRAAVRR